MRFLLILLILSSCNPGKQLTKAEARLAEAGRLSAICAERFPIKDKVNIPIRNPHKKAIEQCSSFFDLTKQI